MPKQPINFLKFLTPKENRGRLISRFKGIPYTHNSRLNIRGKK